MAEVCIPLFVNPFSTSGMNIYLFHFFIYKFHITTVQYHQKYFDKLMQSIRKYFLSSIYNSQLFYINQNLNMKRGKKNETSKMTSLWGDERCFKIRK